MTGPKPTATILVKGIVMPIDEVVAGTSAMPVFDGASIGGDAVKGFFTHPAARMNDVGSMVAEPVVGVMRKGVAVPMPEGS